MLDAFHNGGWGMYPTTIAGFILIAVAVRYAQQPDPRRLQLIRVLSFLVFLVACLGFVAGVINSFTFASSKPDELGTLVVAGVGESLNNIGLGVGLLVIATIIRAIGVSRGGSASGGGSELHDPHAQ